ncbi:hypothetical protein C343_02947 [Cryptococcus neoformans C23]|uniref:Uncharacterized protein n=2 Tax=Cryptococcus neoformans TaxID=5207 RepID=A0A854QBN3_CRYNE|nr:hypothetical protein CNAG_01281 [Cryptococcus neoformans var. grubii H99]AUB24587.1 hypothetical protein CKF44_01281 [Cryptococcus neoformans var. grubii]OWZ32315.1 hypothetical protein C347_03010 [Cryptococcus neoformans var. grubii AD2-60a]OWZ44162.1 hypothetical protein C343_02947 [Cryptococcus neoformans var. grubii C23]OWZ44728.1 hypothetical protein C353_02850 [Cryptococcus neoformans var. grubii AD1-83a]OWZ57821.1 hypothetical protein C368_00991 [Cryptococcus neoformans var. grubii 1|eukprot:XP_012049439.1 hypothetical protein CNAG_01281 [Cryptococcus neoformans var. grubii H99]
MAPPTVLSSPLLSLESINILLTSPAPQTVDVRIQLLSAKILALSNLPLSPACLLDVQKTRFQLGKTYLRDKFDLKCAEIELSMVQRECKELARRKSYKADELGHYPNQENTGKETVLEDEALQNQANELKVEAMRLLVEVEEGLGRPGRAATWRSLIEAAVKDA